jgi:hypothetical protein
LISSNCLKEQPEVHHVIREAHARCLVLALALLMLAASVSSRDVSSQGRSRPNVLFAIADDWSFGHASVYGAKWVRTPAIDRVARDGVLFTRAHTPNAKCAPPRAILLTGRPRDCRRRVPPTNHQEGRF